MTTINNELLQALKHLVWLIAEKGLEDQVDLSVAREAIRKAEKEAGK